MNYKVVELESKEGEKVKLSVSVSPKTPPYLEEGNRVVRVITNSSQGEVIRYTDLWELADSADNGEVSFKQCALRKNGCMVTEFEDELDYLVKDYVLSNIGVFEELRG